MKLAKSHLIAACTTLAAMLSFAVSAAPFGQRSNVDGVKPVPSVLVVRTSNGLFLSGDPATSLTEGSHNVMAPSKNINCENAAGCVVLITVVAQVGSGSTANQWGLDPQVDGKDINPAGGPVLGDSQTSEFDTRSFTGTLQVSKGKHAVETTIIPFGNATLYAWSESVQVLQ
jgi:hypothetical protein